MMDNNYTNNGTNLIVATIQLNTLFFMFGIKLSRNLLARKVLHRLLTPFYFFITLQNCIVIIYYI